MNNRRAAARCGGRCRNGTPAIKREAAGESEGQTKAGGRGGRTGGGSRGRARKPPKHEPLRVFTARRQPSEAARGRRFEPCWSTASFSLVALLTSPVSLSELLLLSSSSRGQLAIS